MWLVGVLIIVVIVPILITLCNFDYTCKISHSYGLSQFEKFHGLKYECQVFVNSRSKPKRNFSMGKDQHVTTHPNGWQVKGEGNTKATVVSKTQAESEKIAKNQKSEVVIHGIDGKIRDKKSYGNDPKNIKG